MAEVLLLLLIPAAFAAILIGLALLARRTRRRGGGSGGSVLGPFEELWHPAAHRSHIEIQAQDERRAPNESPSDE